MVNDRHSHLALLTVVMGMLALLQPVRGVPSLQLYSPGAEYNEDTEAWLTYDDPFTLTVAGAKSPAGVHRVENVQLWISLPQVYQDSNFSQNGGDVSVTVRELSSSGNVVETLNLGQDDLKNGLPGMGPNETHTVPPHGAYPTDYWKLDLDNLEVASAGETVYNYDAQFDPQNPGEGHSGDLQHYEIEYTPYDPEVLLHIDLGGHLVDEGGQSIPSQPSSYRFAPFSHDADAAYTPEPATLTLFSLLLCGAVGTVLWRARKRSA